MRLPNSYGSVSKLKGKRRRPYIARITTYIEFDEETLKYKQVQKALGYYATKAEALNALAEYNHEPYDLDARKITFGEIYKKLEFPEVSERNYIAAYQYLKPIEDMALQSIKAGHMQECIDSCKTTQQNFIKTICKKVYTYALKNEIIDKNPSQYLTSVTPEAKIERKIFTHEEVEELWTLTDYWWARVTLMLLFSGMRTKELRTIPIERIDTANRWLELQAGKNACSIRGLPIHERAVPLFDQYVADGGNLYNYSHGNLNRLLRDFHGHTAHDTRHSFSTRMREIGTDHLIIKRLLGHTPTDITERVYTHLTQEELTSALDKLDY